MRKATIIGCIAEKHELFDGQTIKTKTIKTELEYFYGKNEIEIIDTYKWRKNKFRMISKSFRCFLTSENIIMLPNKNGLDIFAPLLSILNKIFKKKLHYIVIGGWLYEYLIKKAYLIRFLKNFDGIYVELSSMKEKLLDINLNNTWVIPNFKHLEKAKIEDIVAIDHKIFRFCTFSRVMEEKGISNAIRLVNNLNTKNIKCGLDIYGKIDQKYEVKFRKLLNNNKNVKYKGLIAPNDSVVILKDYAAMLFLTEYEGEGFPGTLIDALFAGLPVIATDWKYNNEIIKNGITGILVEVGNNDELEKCAKSFILGCTNLSKMRINCLNYADDFLGEKVISCLTKRM